MTLVSSDDDLDWEFVFDSRLGHPTGSSEEPMVKRSKKRCEELPIHLRLRFFNVFPRLT